MKKKDLPTSPHLQIYKPQITSMLSIAHRISGFCLNIVIIFFSFWIISLALGEKAYNYLINVMLSVPTKIVILLSILGFCYHFLNGLRHMMWDFGFLLDLKVSTISGYLILIFSIMLTIFLILKIGVF